MLGQSNHAMQLGGGEQYYLSKGYLGHVESQGLSSRLWMKAGSRTMHFAPIEYIQDWLKSMCDNWTENESAI